MRIIFSLYIFCFFCHSKIIWIPLGSMCMPALMLRSADIRTEAYPFDWNVTPFRALFTLLNDNFKSFLGEPYAIGGYTNSFKDRNEMQFPHDFPEEGPERNNLPLLIQKYLPEVKDKYKRRIERFYQVIQSTHPRDFIIFLRYKQITDDEAKQLYKILRKNFSHLKFILIIIGPREQPLVELKRKRIIKLGISEYYDSSQQAGVEPWKKLFQRILSYISNHHLTTND